MLGSEIIKKGKPDFKWRGLGGQNINRGMGDVVDGNNVISLIE